MLKLIVLAALIALAAGRRGENVPLPNASAVGITMNRIESLPGYGRTKELSFSGYLSVDPTGRGSLNNGLFYWLFYSRGVPFKDPLVLWLNGGPGASSFYGAFCELGPYRPTPNTTLLTDNPYTWNLNANLLVIDQPIGVGWSFGPRQVGNQDQVASDIYFGLQYLLNAFPFLKGVDFYVTGESYAGKYVPSISYGIHLRNQKVQPPFQKINLKGLAIGNGWVHPIVQNQAYVDYPYNMGLIGDYEHDVAQSVMDELANCINNGSWFKANDLSNELEAIVVEASGVEIDDIMYSKDPVEPYAKALKAWFAQKSVQNAIGTTGFKPEWAFVNETVESFFDADEQQSVLPLIPILIDQYRVFIYTGNMDLNVNVAGVDAYIKVMGWKDYPNYYSAKRVLWYTGDELSGYAKNWDNLTVLVIRNAGHEVPFYQPAAALDMLNHLTSGAPFEQ